MKTSLDCIPCILRQSLDAARLVSTNPSVHEQIIRDVLSWAGEMDLNQSAPAMAQRIHRQLREITGANDPYRDIKDWQNRIAMELIPALRAEVESANDPLLMATRLAIAGNVIDMGSNGNLTEADVRQALNQALIEPFFGEQDRFRQAIAKAKSILYLADNAGEIAFDQLLVEQISPERVTFVVRGSPVINDATLADARTVGLDKIVKVIDNGSDAPGTILNDCRQEFRRCFADADLIIAKGQGNFETLSNEPGNIFFLFKVKCAVIADLVNQPIGMQMLVQSSLSSGNGL
ncbi:damage-control phosphatase ARMT1 family protein [Calothrix sp. UHCC 0171]|uniref:damage-control phosphatase ARMT1 family protein n=1 Tax=Calothrix sp. UHCC 0171 TaxID=3110245 RepID=UPI002B1F4C67|nr:ARMT1-like domain-containing protein [Calothrix sp. UHCC 0171]MEA5573524.1 ARMT1-like domain-containing protein [Calothrix sp. UHCC 0171]